MEGEVPTPTTKPALDTDTATRLRAAIGRLSRRLRTTAAGQAAGLSPTGISLLLNVDRDGPLRLSELPPLLRRPGDLDDRHLDADDRPGVARAQADALEHRARRGRRATDAARAAARPLRRGDRRPRRQAQADDRPADADGAPGPCA